MSKLISPCHVGHPKYMYSVLGLFGHPVHCIVAVIRLAEILRIEFWAAAGERLQSPDIEHKNKSCIMKQIKEISNKIKIMYI